MNLSKWANQKINPILNCVDDTDSYKYTHWQQYPKDTTGVYSYFESRGGDWPSTIFFGLQYILMNQLLEPITQVDVDDVYELCRGHFNNPHLFNKEGWDHIVNDHGGHWPVSIKAVPEGTIVPVHNVLMTVENTCPHCYWVTNLLETLLVRIWYPTTVATLSYEIKKSILASLKMTGDPSLIEYKLHDFGSRGSTSRESANIGGLAHLVNFKGTDTFSVLRFAMTYYAEAMAGHSIPAAEHSTIISWGEKQEKDAYRNMLNKFPEGLVAVVSDSYDIRKACDEVWGCVLKNEVLAHKGTVVIRPDSGTPHKIVPEIFEILANRFGHTVNNKGFKELPPQLAVIQGDGMNYSELNKVLDFVNAAGWSTNQLAFGMGGALLQGSDRDTQECAFKCSEVVVDGETRSVSKTPVTDYKKASKAGRLQLISNGFSGKKKLKTVVPHPDNVDLLREVYRNGEILIAEDLNTIRQRIIG